MGVCLVSAPILIRADDGEEAEMSEAERLAYADELDIEILGVGGSTRYTSCDNRYQVNYGGLSSAARLRMSNGPSFRASTGLSYAHTEQIEPPDEVATNKLPNGGLVLQVGEDFTWWGFLVGGGLWYFDDDFFPFPSAELRIGPLRPLHVRFALAEDGNVGHSFGRGEIVLARENYAISVGVQLIPYAESIVPHGRLELAISDRVRLLAGVAILPSRNYAYQGELGVAFTLDH